MSFRTALLSGRARIAPCSVVLMAAYVFAKRNVDQRASSFVRMSL